MFGGRVNLNIYDFGVYIDPGALRASSCAAALAASPPAAPAFGRALRSADDVPMTLAVRLRHTLPVPMLRSEYRRILGRRVARVGGSPSDAALDRMISHFRADALPPGARAGRGSVKMGTVLEFVRGPGGSLAASADGVPIVRVESPALAAAVFDIYVGDMPVSPEAKLEACAAAAALVAGTERPPRRAGALVCAGGDAAAAACPRGG